jgi:hypothetical protein
VQCVLCALAALLVTLNTTATLENDPFYASLGKFTKEHTARDTRNCLP